MKNLEKALVGASNKHSFYDTGFADFLGAVEPKDIEIQQKVAEFELVIRSFNDQNEQLCQKIEQMENDRRDMIRKSNQLSYENAEFKEKLEESEKYYGNNNEIKKLQDESYENKRRLTDAVAQLEELEKKLQEKCVAHEKSLSVIQKACEHIEDLELHVEQLKSSQPNSLSSTESAKNVSCFQIK